MTTQNLSTFVFLDDRPWPYCVKLCSDGNFWLYYWSEGNRGFVSMRAITDEEANRFREYALPADKAKLYLEKRR